MVAQMAAPLRALWVGRAGESVPPASSLAARVLAPDPDRDRAGASPLGAQRGGAGRCAGGAAGDPPRAAAAHPPLGRDDPSLGEGGRLDRACSPRAAASLLPRAVCRSGGSVAGDG